MLFRSKKAPPPLPPDREPAIRQSICTGEMTGGYIDGPAGRTFSSLFLAIRPFFSQKAL